MFPRQTTIIFHFPFPFSTWIKKSEFKICILNAQNLNTRSGKKKTNQIAYFHFKREKDKKSPYAHYARHWNNFGPLLLIFDVFPPVSNQVRLLLLSHTHTAHKLTYVISIARCDLCHWNERSNLRFSSYQMFAHLKTDRDSFVGHRLQFLFIFRMKRKRYSWK